VDRVSCRSYWRRYALRHLAVLVVVLGVMAMTAVPAFALSPGTGGQPSQSCLSSTAPSEPGKAASAPGSAFHEPSGTDPGGVAGQMYAGNGQNTNTPANGAAVSQYDVACFEVSQH
jgi:hypothetical protein